MPAGNCVKCGNPLDMHYIAWCPSCEPPEPEMRKVFDFFKTARYIARQSNYEVREYDSLSWENKILDALNFPCNDSFIEIAPGQGRLEHTGTAKELQEYCEGLVNHFDIGDNETIILEISW